MQLCARCNANALNYFPVLDIGGHDVQKLHQKKRSFLSVISWIYVYLELQRCSLITSGGSESGDLAVLQARSKQE